MQELHEPYLVKEMLKTAIGSYREEQEETCDITARSVSSLGTGGGGAGLSMDQQSSMDHFLRTFSISYLYGRGSVASLGTGGSLDRRLSRALHRLPLHSPPSAPFIL